MKPLSLLLEPARGGGRERGEEGGGRERWVGLEVEEGELRRKSERGDVSCSSC